MYIDTHLKLSRIFRSLYVLEDGGIPLLKSFDIILNQVSSKRLKEIIKSVSASVNEGFSLAEGLAQKPDIFPAFAINMIKVGEESGTLGVIFKELALYFEEREAFRNKIIRALAYPLVVLLVSFFSVIFLITFLIPIFGSIFKELGVALPPLTRIIIWFSDAISSSSHVFIIFSILIASLIYYYSKKETGKRVLDMVILRIPFIGSLIKKSIISRTLKTLGLLLRGGVPTLQAISTAMPLASNKIYIEALSKVKEDVEIGEKLSASMYKTHLFPQDIIQMVEIGEESGTLPQILLQAATYYEEEIEHATKTLTSVIEPVATLSVGIIVGFIIVAMFMPLMSMVSALQ